MCRFPPTPLMPLKCGKVCDLPTSSHSQIAKRTSRQATSSNIAMSAWGQPFSMIPRSPSCASSRESARQEPCVFYYLADGPDGRPRMCGNPHFSRCIHQMMCRECEAFIDSELAEVIEKREGALIISVPVPLPPQMVHELNQQDEEGLDITTRLETLPPPALPGPAFHFNKKVPMRSPRSEAEDVNARLQQVE